MRQSKKFENFEPRTTEIYGNCTVLSVKGTPMFKCIQKKANWYLKRNLATVITENPLVIQLNFEAKGNGWEGDEYYLSEKPNVCVQCGEDILDVLTKHHIVPYMYRRCMPIEIKKSSSFDITPMCLEHHGEYEAHADLLKFELAKKYGAPMHNRMTTEQKELKKAKSYANIRLKYWPEIPEHKKEKILFGLKEYFGTDEYTTEDLEKTSKINIKNLDPEYEHAKVVISKVENLQEFVEMWRFHFLKFAEPQFMSTGWDPKRSIYKK